MELIVQRNVEQNVLIFVLLIAQIIVPVVPVVVQEAVHKHVIQVADIIVIIAVQEVVELLA